jgi:hypothetical protein
MLYETEEMYGEEPLTFWALFPKNLLKNPVKALVYKLASPHVDD